MDLPLLPEPLKIAMSCCIVAMYRSPMTMIPFSDIIFNYLISLHYFHDNVSCKSTSFPVKQESNKT